MGLGLSEILIILVLLALVAGVAWLTVHLANRPVPRREERRADPPDQP